MSLNTCPAAVGSRVKYVMDTSEVIWGCLDAGSHLEAARRLLRVQEVHSQLQASYAPTVAAKFPVLSHQWQTVLKFRWATTNPGCCCCSLAGSCLSGVTSQVDMPATTHSHGGTPEVPVPQTGSCTRLLLP